MKIPLVNLKIQYQSIKKEIDKAIFEVINETAFIKGPFVKQFEENYAKQYDVKHCIGVANGTDAIYIALKALGVGPGDEVITVANSWISTSEAITQTGAKPVFVDIEKDYYTIDPKKIEKKITNKTKAVIPVHLFGHPANITEIKNICQKHNLFLIEDCAQAHFAQYNNQNIGTFGDIGTFSFFPGKNLGAYGDAGGIITNNDELAKKCKMFACHGALVKHEHKIEGINSRLDGLQAAILNVKLKYIQEWTEKRIKNANLYTELLNNIGDIVTPKTRPNSKHVFHLYVIRTKNRDELQKFLKEKGVATGVHYPTPLPLLPAYKYLNHSKKDFPIASKYQHKILSLPMYPELNKKQIEYIAKNIKKFFK